MALIEVYQDCYVSLHIVSLIYCSTPQINTWTDDWIEFYSKHRLGYQLELASRRYGDSAILEKGTDGKKTIKLVFIISLPVCHCS